METIYQFKQTDFEKFLSDIKHMMREEIKTIQIAKPDKELSTKQAAAYLRISRKTYYRWIHDGTIPADIIHRRGVRVYFFESELEALVKKS